MRRSIQVAACGNSARSRALSPNSKAENSKPALKGSFLLELQRGLEGMSDKVEQSWLQAALSQRQCPSSLLSATPQHRPPAEPGQALLTWRHRAANQRPLRRALLLCGIPRHGAKPSVGGYHMLQLVARRQVGAHHRETHLPRGARIQLHYRNWPACMGARGRLGREERGGRRARHRRWPAWLCRPAS